MANSTLLSLVSTSLQGLGVTGYGQPSTVVGNTNDDITQTLALVNSAGDDLTKEFDWQWLMKQYIFQATYYQYTGVRSTDSTTVTGMSSLTDLDTTLMVTGTGIDQDTFFSATASGTAITLSRAATATASGTMTFSKVLFSPPGDFDRLVNRTQWDKSKHWEMLGPSTPQQREWLRSGYISTGPRIRYWSMGGYFQIWPPLGANENLSYEYVSKYWVLATGGTSPTKQSFTVDTDTCIFPDSLMRALIKLKYFEVKNFDTTALSREYNRILDLCKAQDSANPTLSMAPRASSVLIGWGNIPDTGYGS